MGYGCLGTGNVEKNGKIVDFPEKKSRGKFHDCSERYDRMKMLQIFQVAAVFFGILMEKISRVQAAGRKMAGRRVWYAAARADWNCGTSYGNARSAVDAGEEHSGIAAAVTGARRKKWGHARRGRKNVTDKVDVGNNPRDGNVPFPA